MSKNICCEKCRRIQHVTLRADIGVPDRKMVILCADAACPCHTTTQKRECKNCGHTIPATLCECGSDCSCHTQTAPSCEGAEGGRKTRGDSSIPPEKREQGVYYDKKTAEQWDECCEECFDVTHEKTYPAHTPFYACLKLDCKCHTQKPLQDKLESHSSVNSDSHQQSSGIEEIEKCFLTERLTDWPVPTVRVNPDTLKTVVQAMEARIRTEEREVANLAIAMARADEAEKCEEHIEKAAAPTKSK